MNKLLLSTISLVALTATPYYDAFGTSLPTPTPHPAPVPTPVPVPSPTTFINSAQDMEDAYNDAVKAAETAGLLTTAQAATIGFEFDSAKGANGGAMYISDVSNANLDVDVDATGGIVMTDSSMYGLTIAEGEGVIAHEIGHSLEPDLDSADNAANNAFIQAADTYGVNSAQAQQALVNFDAASQADEQGADVIAASIMGAQNYVNDLTSFYAIQGANPNADDQTHGTEFDRIVAISAANPGVNIDVPESVTATITTLPVVVDGGKVEPIPTESAPIQTELDNEAIADDKQNVADDHGTDTAKSVDEKTTDDADFINDPAPGDMDVHGTVEDEKGEANAIDEGDGFVAGDGIQGDGDGDGDGTGGDGDGDGGDGGGGDGGDGDGYE